MDTLTAVFKMKLSKTPVSTSFYKPNCFFMATDTEVGQARGWGWGVRVPGGLCVLLCGA